MGAGARCGLAPKVEKEEDSMALRTDLAGVGLCLATLDEECSPPFSVESATGIDRRAKELDPGGASNLTTDKSQHLEQTAVIQSPAIRPQRIPSVQVPQVRISRSSRR
jgi:hypothetical protein